MRTALTIAGSDPSGGAGIQGDLKTFGAHGVYGMAVLTALTAQNTRGVSGVHVVPPSFVAEQLAAVLEDMPVHAAKTGMLASAAVATATIDVLERFGTPPLVVDPVMVASSGAALIEDDAVAVVRERLLPLAHVVTPNLPEAARLLGRAVDGVAGMRRAAEELCRLGARAALVKGGHGAGAEIVDVLFDGTEFFEFRAPRIDTPHTHGTGCALAAGIAAQIAHGRALPDAVARARAFVRAGLAAGVLLGSGTNPLNHLAGGEA